MEEDRPVPSVFSSSLSLPWLRARLPCQEFSPSSRGARALMGELPPPPPLQQQQQQEEEEEDGGVVPPLYSYRRPSGFRFNPTDQVLVVYFLSNKISGRRGLKYDPSTIIPTVDVYGPSSEPWRLCEQVSFPYAPTLNPTEFFCFTTRNQLHTQGDRCHRTAGFGTWFASGKEKEIWDGGGILVGRMSFFSFKVPPLGVTGRIHKNDMVTTHWVMHEYRLESSGSGTTQFQKTVLCRIRNQKKDNDIAKGRWTIPWWEEIPTSSSPPPPSSINHPDDEEDNRGRGWGSGGGTGETSSFLGSRKRPCSSGHVIGCGDPTVMQPLTDSQPPGGDWDSFHTSSPAEDDIQPFSPQTLPPPPPPLDAVTFTSDQPHDGSTPPLPSHCHGVQEDDTPRWDQMMELEEWDQIMEPEEYHLLWS